MRASLERQAIRARAYPSYRLGHHDHHNSRSNADLQVYRIRERGWLDNDCHAYEMQFIRDAGSRGKQMYSALAGPMIVFVLCLPMFLAALAVVWPG